MPICHEYYRSRDNDHLTDEQNARHLQLCDKEMVDRETTRTGKPSKNLRDNSPDSTIVTNLIPNCPGLSAEECSKGIVNELSAVGCRSVSLSCNANKTYCLFGTANCAVPFQTYGGYHKCYFSDTIVHLGSAEEKTPSLFPSEFLCKW